jgi:hypothetical protein
MKTSLIIAIVVAASGTAWLIWRPGGEKPAEPTVDPAPLHEGSLRADTPPEEVFKRALWRRPAPDDKILHAERREWTEDNAEGVAHWQWFLAVEPGPALKKYLERNPFSVRPAQTLPPKTMEKAPAWFPRDYADLDIRTGGNTGSLVFLYSRKGNTIYAANRGDGFTPGAPMPGAAPAAQEPVAGRLPHTPPPDTRAKQQ